MMQVKAAINPISIIPSSCVGSWDFSKDPCDSLSSPIFTCGLDCLPGANGILRVTGLRLDPAGYNGTLSPAVGNLTALQRLVVSGNGFYGPIPETLNRLTTLFQLDLSQNHFSGYLPSSIGAIATLQFMSVSYNNLHGRIPPSLNNLKQVVQMFVDHNFFSGAFPTLDGMAGLLILDASSNNFTQHLPYAYPPMIQSLAFGNNQFAGRLPSVLRNLTNLEVLDLRFNNLRGGVKEFLFDLPNLLQLNLSYNNFSWIEYNSHTTGAGSFLISVDLSENSIRGLLPRFFAGIKELLVLSLRGNLFSGPIPYEYGLRAANAVNGSFQLLQLYLDGNYLSGKIPTPFFKLTPDNITATFFKNCLQCPSSLAFCKEGPQRSAAECAAFKGK